MKRLLILLLVIATFGACKKEAISPTQAQLTASKLSKEMGVSENVDVNGFTINVINTNSNSSLITNATRFNISSDGFIVITNVYSNGVYSSSSSASFNLGQLKAYQIVNSSQQKSLQLCF